MSDDSTDAMRSAIAAANGLRVELDRALVGPLTVAPHVALLGGVVAVYVSDRQADHLADLVRRAGATLKAEGEPVQSDDRFPAAVSVQRARHLTRWGELGMHHPDGTGQPGDAEEAALAVGRTRYDGVHCGASWRTILDEEVREAFAQSDPALLIPRLVRIAAVAGDWFADLEGRSAADARSECGS